MSFEINFDKVKGIHLVNCLANGSPIEGVHTVDEMLALAGACFFVASTHSREMFPGQDPASLHPEHREAYNDRISTVLLGAIGLQATRCGLLLDGSGDGQVDSRIRAMIPAEECLRLARGVLGGEAIRDVRTVNDMLALAGACLCVAGARSRDPKEGRPPSALDPDADEAPEANLADDLRLAIEYYGHLCWQAYDGLYDDEFEPTIKAIVYLGANGKSRVQPLSGFRGHG